MTEHEPASAVVAVIERATKRPLPVRTNHVSPIKEMSDAGSVVLGPADGEGHRHVVDDLN